MTRRDANGHPTDQVMNAFLTRVRELAPDARKTVVSRMWDDCRSSVQLARAVAELLELVPHTDRAAFEWMSGAALRPWRDDGEQMLAPPWMGEDAVRLLYAIASESTDYILTWAYVSLQLATAALYHRAVLSHATIGVLYYPFESTVPLASLDPDLAARMDGALDPTAPGAVPPPRVPRASTDAVERSIEFFRHAPADALAALVRAVKEEHAIAFLTGEGKRAAAMRAVEDAITHAGLGEEVDRARASVVEALQARNDEWRVAHAQREQNARLTEDQAMLLYVATAAVSARIAAHELDKSDVHTLWSPLDDQIARYQRAPSASSQ